MTYLHLVAFHPFQTRAGLGRRRPISASVQHACPRVRARSVFEVSPSTGMTRGEVGEFGDAGAPFFTWICLPLQDQASNDGAKAARPQLRLQLKSRPKTRRCYVAARRPKTQDPPIATIRSTPPSPARRARPDRPAASTPGRARAPRPPGTHRAATPSTTHRRNAPKKQIDDVVAVVRDERLSGNVGAGSARRRQTQAQTSVRAREFRELATSADGRPAPTSTGTGKSTPSPSLRLHSSQITHPTRGCCSH